MRWYKKESGLSKYIFCAIVFIAAILVIFEVYIRNFTEPIFYGWFDDYAFSSYNLRPHQVFLGKKCVNNYGFIFTPDVEQRKSPDKIRIIFIGEGALGSSTGDERGCPVSYFRKKINSAFPGSDIEVLNCSLTGFSSIDSYYLLSSRLVEFHPDIVVMYHGWNELHYQIKGTPKRFINYHSHMDSNPVEKNKLVDRISNIYRTFGWLRWQKIRLKLKGPQRYGKKEPYQYDYHKLPEPGPNLYGLKITKRYFRLIRDLCIKEGIRLFVCKQGLLFYEGMPERLMKRCAFFYHGVGPETHIKSIGEISKIIDDLILPERIIDCTYMISGREEYFRDHAHLTEKGARVIGERIYMGVLPTVRSLAENANKKVVPEPTN